MHMSDYHNLEALQNLICVDIYGESNHAITLHLFKEVIIYNDGKPFYAKIKSNLGHKPPSYNFSAQWLGI